MLETRDRLIGNHRYHVRQLGAGEARKLLVRLTKALGPVLGAMLEDMGGVSGNQAATIKRLQDMNVRSVAKALERLAGQLREEDLEYLCRVLGGATEVETEDGKRLQLTLERQELHFRGGHLAEMFKWLAFGLEVQYADFFSAFGVASPAPGAEEKGS